MPRKPIIIIQFSLQDWQESWRWYLHWFFITEIKVRRIAGGLIPVQKKVRLSLPQILLLLLAGAGLAQYGNFLMAMLQSFISSTTYQDSMTRITEGKSLLMMIFWMGIVAPAAEEMIFRWLIYLRLRDWLKMPVAAVISGLIFGIYHGNIVQGIYASILGTAFAYILEMSGNIYSSMLLHMGANICRCWLQNMHWICFRQSMACRFWYWFIWFCYLA